MTTNIEELTVTMTFSSVNNDEGIQIDIDFPDDFDNENPRNFELAALAAMGFFEKLKGAESAEEI